MALQVRGIVLAAGASTRMGAPKPLLPDDAGRTLIARVLRTLSAAGLTDVTVATGTLHAALVAAVAADPPRRLTVRFARNPDPSRGQLSSLLTALDVAAAPGVDAVLVTLADVPFVAPATVRAVLDGYARTRAAVVRPMREGRHGHPVVFARDLFDELRHADPGLGAKAVVRAHAARVLEVEVADPGAYLDLDTRAEYERALLHQSLSGSGSE